MPLTGERTVPGVPHENYWFRRHEAAYRYVSPYIGGGTVVEVGCGEGYGTASLANRSRRMVGIDYDRATVRHAARRYPQIAFVQANLAALPFRTAGADAIVTLQVIEHVWDHAEFLTECRRVLRPGGRLIVSTPNRLTFSPDRDTPLNPFHTKEFTNDELVALLTASGFVVENRFGLHAGRRLAELDEKHGGSLVDAQLAGAPADWPPELRRDVVGVRVEDFRLLAGHLHRVDEALDLVVLARRPA